MRRMAVGEPETCPSLSEAKDSQSNLVGLLGSH